MVKSIKQIKTAILLLLFFTLLLGLIYPASVTLFAQLFFPWQANGSLKVANDKLVGSVLIGQQFTTANYFWGRPSATSPFPYNAIHSSASNLSMSNPNFFADISHRVASLHHLDPHNSALVPVDLVTASGSGLDPEISPAAAYYQVNRVAKARKLPPEKIYQLVKTLIKRRDFGILGEPRVNVLELNLALDKFSDNRKS